MTKVIACVGPMVALLLSWTHKNKCDLSKHVGILIIWVFGFLDLKTSYCFIGLEANKLLRYIFFWSFAWRLTNSVANLSSLIVKKFDSCEIVFVVKDRYFCNFWLFICKVISSLNSMVSQLTKFFRWFCLIIPMKLNTFKDTVVVVHSWLNAL